MMRPVPQATSSTGLLRCSREPQIEIDPEIEPLEEKIIERPVIKRRGFNSDGCMFGCWCFHWRGSVLSGIHGGQFGSFSS